MTPPRAVVALVMTDGRPGLIDRTIESFEQNVSGPLVGRIINADACSPGDAAELVRRFPGWTVSATPHRSGFGGAIRGAWSLLPALAPAAGYVWHLEDDFLTNRPVRLDRMIDVLEAHPYLVQMALRRQPWNAAERAAGGIVEQHPDDYSQRVWRDLTWLEHRRFFTTNPSLYRMSLVERGWPEGDQSEGRFSISLFEDPNLCSGYWGPRDASPWCHHIGDVRAGDGY